MPAATHDDCFSEVPAQARALLLQIQAEIERRVPGAERCVAHGLPAFRQRRVFVYFAAFKHHVGVYPPLTDDAELMAATRAYRGPKGNLSFPLAEALPLALIGRVAVALSNQYA
jgi:uncharacterized protein YdhG (YjbR/CyaY superfamily)